MASKFIVTAAFFAICHASPVLINGVEHRDGRSYTVGEGFSLGYGGVNQASASVIGRDAQAFGGNSNSNGGIARDGLGYAYPEQAYAKVGTFDDSSSVGIAKAQAINKGPYLRIPAPASVVAYQQNFDVPSETPSQIIYELPQSPTLAQSSATLNGGYGSAISNANTGLGTAASNARAQGSGHGSVSSIAQSNDVIGVVTPTEELGATIIAAKNQANPIYTPLYAPAGYGSAASSANANGPFSSAVSAAKTGASVPTRKSIHWHFGTAYDIPAGYGAAKSVVSGLGYGSANANADVNSGLSAIRSSANSQGSGSAQSAANSDGAGFGSVKSASNSNGYGVANSNADVNNAGYSNVRSGVNTFDAGYGFVKSSANSNGFGFANSNADINDAGYLNSAANTRGQGSAQSSANLGPGYGAIRSVGSPWGSRIASDAQSSGSGVANASARNHGLSTGYRVVNSAANSNGWGNARANALSV